MAAGDGVTGVVLAAGLETGDGEAAAGVDAGAAAGAAGVTIGLLIEKKSSTEIQMLNFPAVLALRYQPLAAAPDWTEPAS